MPGRRRLQGKQRQWESASSWDKGLEQLPRHQDQTQCNYHARSKPVYSHSSNRSHNIRTYTLCYMIHLYASGTCQERKMHGCLVAASLFNTFAAETCRRITCGSGVSRDLTSYDPLTCARNYARNSRNTFDCRRKHIQMDRNLVTFLGICTASARSPCTHSIAQVPIRGRMKVTWCSHVVTCYLARAMEHETAWAELYRSCG